MLSMKHHHNSPINGIKFLIMKFGFYCYLKQKENNNTVDSLSLSLELARDRQICSKYRKFEIEKITVKIKIFTNKAREVNKGLLGMY